MGSKQKKQLARLRTELKGARAKARIVTSMYEHSEASRLSVADDLRKLATTTKTRRSDIVPEYVLETRVDAMMIRSLSKLSRKELCVSIAMEHAHKLIDDVN